MNLTLQKNSPFLFYQAVKPRFGGELTPATASLPNYPHIRPSEDTPPAVDVMILNSERAKEIGRNIGNIPNFSDTSSHLRQYKFDDQNINPRQSILMLNKERNQVRFFTIYDYTHPCAVMEFRTTTSGLREPEKLVFHYREQPRGPHLPINPIAARAFLMTLFNIPSTPLEELLPEQHKPR